MFSIFYSGIPAVYGGEDVKALIYAFWRMEEGSIEQHDENMRKLGIVKLVATIKPIMNPERPPSGRANRLAALFNAIAPILFDGTSEGATKGWLTRRWGKHIERDPEKLKKEKEEEEALAHPRPWKDSDPNLPKDIRSLHKTPDGKYTPERQALHDEIVNDAFKEVKPVPEHQKPIAIFMMGGPASGKSAIVKGIERTKAGLKDFVRVNADDVKDRLPEYQKGINDSVKDIAQVVHEESSDVAKTIRDKAIEGKYNFVYDGTGKNTDAYIEQMRRAKMAGYTVKLIMPNLTPDEAASRAMVRAEKTGRFVPDKFVRDAHNVIPKNFERIGQEADDFAMIDVMGPKARVVWEKNKGKETIHDPEYVDKFRKEHTR